MYTPKEILVYDTAVEPLSSGSKVFTEADDIVDIKELCYNLVKGAIVMIRNDVSTHSSTTRKQMFIVTDELYPEDGYSYTFTFSHFGKSLASVTNRKIIMSFGEFSDGWHLKATYSDT